MGSWGLDQSERDRKMDLTGLGLCQTARLSRVYVPGHLEDVGLPTPCVWVWLKQLI